jgi:hypothetical protein
METLRERRIRLSSLVILGLSTILSSWSAFEGAKWRGRQSADSSRSTTLHVKAARQSASAEQREALHVGLFVAWAQAVASEQSPLQLKRNGYRPAAHAHSTLLLSRFPDDLKPAMAAWLAAHPFQDADVPATPFELPEYRLEAADDAVRLDEQAEVQSAKAKNDSLHADRFVALPVLFSTALFLAGMGAQRAGGRTQELMLAMAFLILIAASVALALVELS